MKIDFESIYNSFESNSLEHQKKIELNSTLSVFYGINKDGLLRLAFLSTIEPPKIESTKMLRVTQGKEKDKTYWTSFDLLHKDAQKVFFSFCSNLIESISGIDDEQLALDALKKRYIAWKQMFKMNSNDKITKEELQGLYGELYFLKNFMIKKYGVNDAVKAWGGPDSNSKDFAVGTEWYEIKTAGAKSPTITISSLVQLSSEYDGRLIIIRVEPMSKVFTNGESSVCEIFEYIMDQITDEITEYTFLNKMSKYKFDMTDEYFNAKFNVKSLKKYIVDEHFPKLTRENIIHDEIWEASYQLLINSLEKFAEE